MLFGDSGGAERPLEHADLPPQRAFASTEDALQWFEQKLSWSMARYVPSYPSHRFCEQLARVLGASAHRVIDHTALVPQGRAGRQSDLPVLLSALLDGDAADGTAVHVVLRTRENTPAFLCGLWHWFVQREGGEGAAHAYWARHKTPTPAAVVITGGECRIVPSHVFQDFLALDAGVTAALLRNRPDEFTCALCGGPFFSTGSSGEPYDLITPLGGACGHPYHCACLWACVEQRAMSPPHCLICEVPFPGTILPEALCASVAARFAATARGEAVARSPALVEIERRSGRTFLV